MRTPSNILNRVLRSLVCTVGLVACDSAPDEPREGEVASITIAAPPADVRTGDFTPLVATAYDKHGAELSGVTFTWRSSNTSIATITKASVLLPLDPGTVRISALAGRASASRSITIGKRAGAPGSTEILVGPAELAFDFQTLKCELYDVPDAPTRVVRLADQSLVVFTGNAPRVYSMRGPDLEHLTRSCTPVLVSGDRPTAAEYSGYEWLTAAYREGGVIHGLVHNEFHDPIAPNCLPGVTTTENPCWYNSITGALSTDDGRTFTRSGVPDRLVAPAPRLWDPTTLPYPGAFSGYMETSNIVRRADGYYYAVFFAVPSPGDWDNPTGRGICVMRTTNLAAPASWRAWNGSSFSQPFGRPYQTGADVAPCKVVSPYTTGVSVSYNTYLDRYILTGLGTWPSGTGLLCGWYYALSTDMVHWSDPKLLRETYLPWEGCRPNDGAHRVIGVEIHPSIIDPADTTVNFERSGRTPYVYFTRYVGPLANRTLFRVPLILVRH